MTKKNQKNKSYKFDAGYELCPRCSTPNKKIAHKVHPAQEVNGKFYAHYMNCKIGGEECYTRVTIGY